MQKRLSVSLLPQRYDLATPGPANVELKLLSCNFFLLNLTYRLKSPLACDLYASDPFRPLWMVGDNTYPSLVLQVVLITLRCRLFTRHEEGVTSSFTLAPPILLLHLSTNTPPLLKILTKA